MKKLNYKFIILCGLFTFTTITNECNVKKCEYITHINEFKKEQQEKLLKEQNIIKDSIANEITSEINKYLTSKEIEKTFNISYFTDTVLESNIDICFVLSQMQLETSCGNTGIGAKKHSMFGVMTKKKYSSKKEAINEYIKLIKNYYLIDNKSEKHLMNNYVSKDGYRYSENKDYEKKLSKIYKTIKNETNIYSLQKKWNKIDRNMN